MKRFHDLYWWKANALNVSCIISSARRNFGLVPNFISNIKDRRHNVFHKFLSHTNYLFLIVFYYLWAILKFFDWWSDLRLWSKQWFLNRVECDLVELTTRNNSNYCVDWRVFLVCGLLASCVLCMLFVAGCVGMFHGSIFLYFHAQQPFAPQCKILCLKYV